MSSDGPREKPYGVAEIAGFLAIVALVSAGASAAIMLPVANNIEQSVGELRGAVRENLIRGAVHQYMINHALEHNIEITHPTDNSNATK